MNKKGQVGRVFLALFLISFGVALFVMAFWGTFNQRVFIPIARWLKFKVDDTEKVQEKVDEILGEDNGKKTEKKSKKSQKEK